MQLWSHARAHAIAATLICSAALAACGPSQPAVTPDGDPPPEPTAAATGAATSDAPAPKAGPAALTESTAIMPSKLLADVEGLGIDMKNPKALKDIELAKKKKMMPLFQKALGYDDCTGCHADGDFKAETKNIKMARNMWDHFVKDMRDEKGGALFCDSCHQGNEHTLVRDDKDKLSTFMEEQYVNKLTRADGEDNSCTTCHGEGYEMDVFGKLWNIE